MRLRVNVYRPIATAKGHRTVAAQARWHRVARSTMFRLLAGHPPANATAMQFAADCGVPVEALWERVA